MRPLHLVASVLLVVPLTMMAAHAPASATGETCEGQPATIVVLPGSPGRVDGTDGADVIVVEDAATYHAVHAGAGDDLVCLAADAGDYVYGDYGNDHLHGGPGNDILDGGAGDDQVWGGAGDDRLYGDAIGDLQLGDASYDPPTGDDQLHGGLGDDTVYSSRGTESLDGGAGNDLLGLAATVWNGAELDCEGDQGYAGPTLDIGSHTIKGGGRTATERGFERYQTGGFTHQTITGTAGSDDVVVGECGASSVSTGGGADHVEVDGRTTLHTGTGPDVVDLDGYRDFLVDGADLSGDRGRDLLRLTVNSEMVYVDLRHGAHGQTDGQVQLAGFENARDLSDKQQDVLIGTDGRNRLVGGSGTTYLRGLGGNDTLLGGAGRDHAFGGRGRDVCRAELRTECEAR